MTNINASSGVTNNYNFQVNLNQSTQTNETGGVSAQELLRALQALVEQSSFQRTPTTTNQASVQYALPAPAVSEAGPPAGRGLSPLSSELREELGLAEDAIAYVGQGGDVIVFDDVNGSVGKGNSMAVYRLDENGEFIKKPGSEDPASFEVWGDPHVDVNGTRSFDFTLDGTIVLPGGTKLVMDTDFETRGNGQSFLDTVTLVSGDEMVSVSGINNNKAETSDIRRGGYDFLAQEQAKAGGYENYTTYVIEYNPQDAGDVAFHAVRHGEYQGKIASSYQKDGIYQQRFEDGGAFGDKIDQALDAQVQVAVGSPEFARLLNALGVNPVAVNSPEVAELVQNYLSSGQDWSQLANPNAMGGAGADFQNFPEMMNALGDLFNQLQLNMAAGNTLNGVNNPTQQGGAGIISGHDVNNRNPDIQNGSTNSVLSHINEIGSVLNDPTLTVEDKVTLMLMLIAKKMDDDILAQAEYINKAQNQSAMREGVRKGGLAAGAGGQSAQAYASGLSDEEVNMALGANREREAELRGKGLTAEADVAAGENQILEAEAASRGLDTTGVNGQANSPSIDVETMKLKRMVDKRSQLMDMLKGIIDKYNETAKGIIQGIGR